MPADNTIIRIARREGYTTIARAALQDNRLSFAARGLLAYLLSKPDDWDVRLTDIQRAGHIGRDKAYRLIDELQQAGYISERQRTRMPGGQWSYTPYYVYEMPISPCPEKPYTVNQDILHSSDLTKDRARNFFSQPRARKCKAASDPVDYGDFRATVMDGDPE